MGVILALDFNPDQIQVIVLTDDSWFQSELKVKTLGFQR